MRLVREHFVKGAFVDAESPLIDNARADTAGAIAVVVEVIIET